jgi:hypothetical protein
MKKKSKDPKLFNDLKACVREFGLPIVREIKCANSLYLCSKINLNGKTRIRIGCSPESDTITFRTENGPIPSDKRETMASLFNLISQRSTYSHYEMDRNTGDFFLMTGILIIDDKIDRKMFNKYLKQLLTDDSRFFPFIKVQLENDIDPESIIKMEIGLNQDNFGSNVPIKINNITLEIHTAHHNVITPAHTHGLAEKGLPEFLIDPFSMPYERKLAVIESSIKYFCKKENESRLNDIMHNQKVKVKGIDLIPESDGKNLYSLCYRRVYPTFEMVKRAYGITSEEDVNPEMTFIQIYVEGRDWVLTDEYYRGGVTF